MNKEEVVKLRKLASDMYEKEINGRKFICISGRFIPREELEDYIGKDKLDVLVNYGN